MTAAARATTIAEVDPILAGDAQFVRIATEDGTTGIGQSAAWGYPAAVGEILRTFARYLVGKDALDVEHHWHYLYRMAPFRGAALAAAVSAVDIALWDIRGKRFDAPIWQLLGGRCRDRIRLHLLCGRWTSLEGLAAEVRAGVAEGFTAIKIAPLPRDYRELSHAQLLARTAEAVAVAREACGIEVDLILELHRALTPLEFLPLAEALRPFSPLFVEDPIQLDSTISQADLARRVSLPLAFGERMHTIWEFRELLEHGGAQVCRPDVGLVGGISQLRKVAALAESHHAPLAPHGMLGPLLTAASVHVGASIPNLLTQEYASIDEGEYAAAFPGALVRDGGYLPLPDQPGLGISLDEAKLTSWHGGRVDVTTRPLTGDGTVPFTY
jgi:galactonate dehydratase